MDQKYIPHLIALIALVAVIILGFVFFFFLKDAPVDIDNQATILYANGKEVQ